MPPATRPILRALEQTYRQPATRTTRPSAPWICNTCRAQTTRLFTTTPKRLQDQNQEPSKQKAPTPTHFSLFPQTFPSGPSYTPNLGTLRREFLSLQQKSHPDLAPSASLKPAYETRSALLNTAYRTLLDPLQRAQYILSTLHDVDVEDEAAKLGGAGEGGQDAGLLMKVMEAREAVEEVEGEEELVGLREENAKRVEASVKVLEEAFEKGEVEKAAREAVRLRYWMNIEESIRGWEKGKGGGILHH